MNTMPPRALPSPDEIRNQIAQLLPPQDSPIRDTDNLLERGLDSLLLMRLIGTWRRAGADVTFGRLIETPTMADWLTALGASQAIVPVAVQTVDDGPFDLSDVQYAYWIGRRDDQPLGGVGCHAYLELDGAGIDPDRLHAAWSRLVDHHPMLRAAFDDEGRQRILPSAAPALPVHDLTDLAPDQVQAALATTRARLDHRRLDVASGHVAGLELSLMPKGATRIHFDIDLLVADVQSLSILLRDLAAAYDRNATPPAPRDWSFAAHLQTQKARRATTHDDDRAYWQARLPDLPDGPALPLVGAPETLGRPTFERRTQRLDAATWTQLRAIAATEHLTPAMVLASAYASVLARWSGQHDITLNLPLFDRAPEFDEVVADFTNLLLLRADHRSTHSFADRTRRLQGQLHADLAHTGYSGVQVQRDIAAQRQTMGGTAPVVFACNLGSPLVDAETARVLGRMGHMISQTPGVWLDHQVYEEDGGVLLCWDSVSGLFPSGLMDAMFSAYGDLLRYLAGDAARWHGALPDLLPKAQAAVRRAVNATDAPLPQGLLHDGFLAQAAAHPDRPALLGHETLSYAELACRALRVTALLRAQGIAAGDAVAITLPRGADQIAATLGTLAAGAVYVPVAPDQPPARADRIHAAAGIRFTLDAAAMAQLPPAAPTTPTPIAPDQPAYVIFTSGSTGEPKGVEITHAAALNTIAEINRRFAISDLDRVLAVSALDFDLSVQDIFGTLAAGGALVLLADEDRREAARWHAMIDAHRVTVWNAAPALLEMLLAVPGGLPSLRLALASGDWIALDLPARLRERSPDCRFIALGGATEAAIWSNACEVDTVPPHWRSIPYGRPLANQRYRVVDSAGRDCPDWVAGELWIGGAGLATGYRGDPGRTAERFTDGWYRTGDMGRYWPDGTLEFLGRADTQVKIRGHRIELGEVEAALEAHPAIHQAAALALGERGRKRLAAFVVGDAPDLAAHLARLLPAHAIPPTITPIKAMPLTPNGKIDRKALARQVPQARTEPTEMTDIEQRIAEIWKNLLGLESITRDDSFLAMGGDSVMATRLITRLRGIGVETSLSDIFARPVLHDFARGLTQGEARATATIHADLIARHDPFPPTEVQQAYLMGRGDDFDLGGVSCHFYTEFDADDLDLDRLESVWNHLIARHEMLRAVFDDKGQQRILATVPRFAIPVIDVTPDTEATAKAALRNAMSDQVLDPARWPLFDIRAVRCQGRVRLGVSLDSIILDALSTMILFTEVETLYADPAAVLRPVDVSFRDYVTQVEPDPARMDADRAYWRETAATLPAGPQLPLACDPASIGKPQFIRHEAMLDPASFATLTERARARGLTISSILATAFAETLAAWSAEPDFTINLTLFDRQEVHPDINNILGDFTSLMLLPYHAQGGNWAEKAARLQAQSATNIAHGSVSAVWVMREMSRQSGAMNANMPIIFTSVIGMGAVLPPMPAKPALHRAWGISQTPQVWLDCQIVEREDGLSITWDSVSGLFPSGLMDAMFSAYGDLLRYLAGDAARWHGALPDLLPKAQAAVRRAVNATDAPLPQGLLHDGFLAQAAAHPDRPALLGHETLSYAELACRALRVTALLRAQGIAAGDAVAITLPRGADQIAATLGTLAAGAVYVPVAPDQPPARADRIHAAAGIRFTLDAAAMAQLPPAAPTTPTPITPDQPAYVIFTSGSTGEPKGVEITHAAALNTIAEINRRFAISDLDRVLAVSALDFDLSVQDIFGTLAAGGALVLLADEDRREAARWHAMIDAHRVTVWNAAPALLEMLLAVPGGLPSLRLALASGDWIALDLPARLRERSPDCRFIALGGATEAAIWSNACEVDTVPPHWRSIPYGRPLANQRYRVVDSAGRDCPDWVAGELWIGGAGLATGYRGDPRRTAERFTDGWYRTGDMGRYWPDGTLEFLGRADTQVKIRGHRIELGEVEAALEAHPAIHQAAALALGERGRKRLAAFVVGDAPDLAAHLARLLPAHAIPPTITPIKAMPLTPNGKIDRKALVRQVPQARTEPTEMTDIEQRIAEIWKNLLGLESITRDDSFLAMGGDSLLATEMVATVGRDIGVEISLRQIFAEPTIAGLAGVITEKLSDNKEHIEEGAL